MKLGKKILILFLSLLLCFSGIGGGISLIIQGSNLRAETVEAKDKGVSALAGPLYNDYWTSNQIYYNTDWEGDGTATSPYKISSNADLAGLAYEVNNGNDHRDHYFKQTADINLGAHYWNPIGGHSTSGVILREDCYFAGYYDGGNYTIDNMYVRGGNSSSYSYQGLFGYVKCPIINNNDIAVQNVIIGHNSNVAGYDFVGGIVGRLSTGVVKNCSSSANIENTFTGTAECGIGGVIGRCDGDNADNSCSIVENCYNYGLIQRGGQAETGTSRMGGVIGFVSNYASIKNCYNAGTIRAGRNDSAGGVIGYVAYINRVGVDGCYNVSTISGTGNAGGIVGCANVGSTDTVSKYKCGFANCYNTGTITGSGENVGGIIGYLSLSSTAITEIPISGCYNIAAVTGGNYVGGIAGLMIGMTTINNSYNSGVVAATNGSNGIAGGILGSSLNNILVINQSTNEGEVRGGQNVGGIIGYSNVTDTNQHKTTVTSSRNLGAINATSIYVGGIIGNSNGDSANSSEIKNCYNAGNVTTTKSITAANSDGTGGIVGRSVNTTISNCYNRASVTAASGYIVGGIVGWGANNSKIYNCFNTGAVSSRTQSGGIIGFNNTASYLMYSYYGGACTLNNAYGSSTNTTAAYLAYYNNKSGSIYTSGISNPVSNNIYANLVTYIQQAAFFTGTYNSFTYWNSGYGWSFSDSNSIWQTTSDHPVLRTVASAPSSETLENASIVTYDANGGIGYMTPQFTKSGDVRIKDCEFSYAYAFVTWNTQRDGGGIDYEPGYIYKENEGLTLFAIWNSNDPAFKNTYVITFDLNGGTTEGGEISLHDIEYHFDDPGIYLPTAKKDTGEEDPTQKFGLVGWQPTADSGNWDTRVIYKAGVELTHMYGDVKLRAVWGSDFWTAHYNDNPSDPNTYKFKGAGTASNPYIIDSEAKLAYLAYLVNSGDASVTDKYFRQTSVLNLYDHIWEPIGTYDHPFRGVYDGGGLEIHKLITPIERTAENAYRGLFGEVDAMTSGSGSTIKNVYIAEDSKIRAYTSSGAVAGCVRGKGTIVKNCINYAEVQCDMSTAGGIVGSAIGSSNDGPTIQNCKNYGRISGASELGGICGNASNTVKIESCENHGAVAGTDSNVGGICGRIYNNAANYGIFKSHNDAQISGINNIGGIAGYANDSRMINVCYNDGNISAAQSGAGGIVGEAIASGADLTIIKECYNTGRIVSLFSGSATTNSPVGYAGGICATASGGLSIVNSYNRGEVSLANGDGAVGGVVGRTAGSTIKNCYNVAEVLYKSSSLAGGVLGVNSNGSSVIRYNYCGGGCSLQEAYGTGVSITNEKTEGGYVSNLIGKSKKEDFYKSGWDTSSNWNFSVWQLVAYKNDGYLSFKDETQLTTLNSPRNSTLWTDAVPTNYDFMSELKGTGVSGDPYLVSTAEQLAAISAIVCGRVTTFANKTFVDIFFKQTADIDLSAYYWNPIGQNNTNAFKGIYDGDGHTISGMFINNNGNVGLFGYVSGATAVVRNVIISADSYVNGYGDVGGIAAKIDDNATVENCVNNAYIVSNNACMGGIVGTLQTSKIKNCTNNGSIFMLGDSGTTNAVGGICGRTTKNNIEISGSYNNGKVFSKLAESTGGIVGKVEDGSNINITNCQNRGEVCEAGTKVGGIVGKAESVSVTITGSDNSGKISGTTQVGGIVGSLSGGSASVNNSYNTGHVFGTIDVGGIIGLQGTNTTVTKCYNAGLVYGLGMMGGVVGEMNGSSGLTNAILSNCYNIGDVVVSGTNTDGGTRVSGGVIGCSAYGTVANCYNAGTISVEKVEVENNNKQFVGGIAGSDATSNSNKITNCINAGIVTSNAAESVGGVIANASKANTITNCYWTKTYDENMPANAIGEAATLKKCTAFGTAIFRQKTFYENSGYWDTSYKWDFSSIWAIDENINNGYPFLRETSGALTSVNNATIIITNSKSGATLSGSTTYTGEQLNVNVTLSGYNGEFKLGSQYKLTIFKNGLALADASSLKDAGEYVILVEGKGNFTGRCETIFTVMPYDFTADARSSSASVRVSSPKDGAVYKNFPYTGFAPEPKFEIVDNTTKSTLKENIDYVVTYPEDGEYGTKNVVIKGIGNYAGTINVKVNVTLKAQFDIEYGYWYVEAGYMPQSRVGAGFNEMLNKMLKESNLTMGNSYTMGFDGKGQEIVMQSYIYNNTEYAINDKTNQWYVVEPIRWALNNITDAQPQAVLAQIVSIGRTDKYSSLVSSFNKNISTDAREFFIGKSVNVLGAYGVMGTVNRGSYKTRLSDYVWDSLSVKRYFVYGNSSSDVQAFLYDTAKNEPISLIDSDLCGVQFTVTLTSFAR